jgi:hypothetical protein
MSASDHPTPGSKKKPDVLMTVGGSPVYINSDGSVMWVGEFTIDADGCPRAYGPEGCSPEPLDYLANAGYDGNWWGIVTDNHGNPYEQEQGDLARWPYPGLYVSTTAYLVPGYSTYDCRHYVDSEKVNFAVVPGNVRMSIPPKFLGCRVVVTDRHTKKQIECACCDVGPSNHLGEGSIALAEAFGISGDPKSGGSSNRKRFHYQMWPGIPSEDFTLQ